jgi:hypothetical protein
LASAGFCEYPAGTTQGRWHDRRPFIGRLRQFVGHFEEQQEGDLLRVGHVRQPVVPQDVGEVPGFVDDVLGCGSHSKDHASLGTWVSMMRAYRKKGKLSEDRIRRLNQIGFVWDGTLEARMTEAQEEAWESKYAALVEYKRTHGHCRVPIRSKDHPSLGNWVRTMRGYRRRGKLSKERIRRLDELGFVWDGKQESGTSD